jgi:glyoxylase-like metal-dependent hydrolase (beta-lactamase superfamily II)
MAPKNENGGQGEPGVAVYQGLPDVEMIVAEGNVVSPSGDDKAYEEGEKITVDGPTAIALATAGHATPVEQTEK